MTESSRVRSKTDPTDRDVTDHHQPRYFTFLATWTVARAPRETLQRASAGCFGCAAASGCARGSTWTVTEWPARKCSRLLAVW